MLPLAVESTDVLADYAVLLEYLLAVGASESIVVTMLGHVHFQLQDVVEALFANWAFEHLFAYEVGLYVASQSGIV